MSSISFVTREEALLKRLPQLLIEDLNEEDRHCCIVSILSSIRFCPSSIAGTMLTWILIVFHAVWASAFRECQQRATPTASGK